MAEEKNVRTSIEDWKKAKEKSDEKCKKLKKKIKKIKRKLKESDYMYTDDKKKMKRKLKKYRKAYDFEKNHSDYLTRELEASEDKIQNLEREKENMAENFELRSKIQYLETRNSVQSGIMGFLVRELAPGIFDKYRKDISMESLPDKNSYPIDVLPFK